MCAHEIMSHELLLGLLVVVVWGMQYGPRSSGLTFQIYLIFVRTVNASSGNVRKATFLATDCSTRKLHYFTKLIGIVKGNDLWKEVMCCVCVGCNCEICQLTEIWVLYIYLLCIANWLLLNTLDQSTIILQSRRVCVCVCVCGVGGALSISYMDTVNTLNYSVVC